MDGCHYRRRRRRRFCPARRNIDDSVDCVGEGLSVEGTSEEKEVDIEHPLDGIINVGAGSMLVRRESQFPFITPGICN